MSTVLGLRDSTKLKVMADPVPKIRAAGFQISGVDLENADYSIRQDVFLQPNEPSTPDTIKKFRKSHVNQPGQIQKHPGVADDPLKFPKNYSYGKATYDSEHVQHLIKAQNLNGL